MITDDDLQAALDDELRAIHAEYLAELQQPGEFTQQEYERANGLQGRQTARGIIERMVADGKLTMRRGRHSKSGTMGNLYKIVIKLPR